MYHIKIYTHQYFCFNSVDVPREIILVLSYFSFDRWVISVLDVNTSVLILSDKVKRQLVIHS